MDNVTESVQENEISQPETVGSEEAHGTILSDETIAKVQPVEDRSAFNCSACGGEGLKNGTIQDQLCPECNGTGRTSGDYATMQPGTIVVTKNGTFTVDSYGQLVAKE